MTLRLHAFLPRSRANGPGWRSVVWVQGCSLGCPGCFNPQTHDWEGIAATPEAEAFILPDGRVVFSGMLQVSVRSGTQQIICSELVLPALHQDQDDPPPIHRQHHNSHTVLRTMFARWVCVGHARTPLTFPMFPSVRFHQAGTIWKIGPCHRHPPTGPRPAYPLETEN
ncbi:MAG: radical SAM protein [Akkermansiaceae bacterium]|jgi:hypothetical protein|nr:radical SAM protein [Akkermansiaceae bacterium]